MYHQYYGTQVVLSSSLEQQSKHGSKSLLFSGFDAYLDRSVRIQEHVFGADAAVDAAHGHKEAEGKEVAVVEVAHAVIQPGCRTHGLRTGRLIVKFRKHFASQMLQQPKSRVLKLVLGTPNPPANA